MPRANRGRTSDAEDRLASRLQRERESRGWSYAEVAARLSQVGCTIHSSAIYKIEKGSPRRAVTAIELAAFALVFETTPNDLLASLHDLLARKAALQETLREVEEEIAGQAAPPQPLTYPNP